MATTRETLAAAKALIDTPEKWARGAFARTAKGDYIGLDEASACAFCAMGALCRAADSEEGNEDFKAAYDALLRQVPRSRSLNIVDFNDDDTTTHADVMALFDRAIAAQGGRQWLN